jgi:hypothetical protein
MNGATPQTVEVLARKHGPNEYSSIPTYSVKRLHMTELPLLLSSVEGSACLYSIIRGLETRAATLTHSALRSTITTEIHDDFTQSSQLLMWKDLGVIRSRCLWRLADDRVSCSTH